MLSKLWKSAKEIFSHRKNEFFVLNDGTKIGPLPDISLPAGHLRPHKPSINDNRQAFPSPVPTKRIGTLFTREFQEFQTEATSLMVNEIMPLNSDLRDHAMRFLVWKCIEASTEEYPDVKAWFDWLLAYTPPLDHVYTPPLDHHGPTCALDLLDSPDQCDLWDSPDQLEYPRYSVATMVSGKHSYSDSGIRLPGARASLIPCDLLERLSKQDDFKVDARDIDTGLTSLGEVIVRYWLGNATTRDCDIIDCLLSCKADPYLAIASAKMFHAHNNFSLATSDLPPCLETRLRALHLGKATPMTAKPGSPTRIRRI